MDKKGKRGQARKGGQTGTEEGKSSRRLWKAAIVLLSISLGLSLVQLALRLSQPKGADALEGPSMASAGEAVLQGSTAEEALAAQGLSPVSEGEVPAWVADEVLDASLCAGAYANGDWSVLGVVREGSAAELFGEMSAALEQRGWAAHDSGAANVATFTKEEGEATWAMLQCTAVGGWTTAVLQLSR